MSSNQIKAPDGTIYHVNPESVISMGTRQHLLKNTSSSSDISEMEIASANTFLFS